MTNEVHLVTGAAGFIGFHLSRSLLERGQRVVGVDCVNDYYDVKLKYDRLSMLEKYEFFEPVIGNLQQADVLGEVGSKYTVQRIYHLAAQAGVRHSIENPRDYLNSNIQGTFNVLEFAKDFKVDHLMLASTSSVYGASSASPLDEKLKTDHQMSFYAASKKATEVMAHSYSHIYSIPTTVFQFFTVYGPWGRPDMALFKFTKNILNKKPISVFNMGDMARDFTYVSDLCRDILDLSEKIPIEVFKRSADKIIPSDSVSDIAPFRVVNIGSNNPIKLEQFIQTIEMTLGAKATKEYLPMQIGDIQATHASTSLLENLVGPRTYTSLEDGVAAFIEWYRSYYDT